MSVPSICSDCFFVCRLYSVSMMELAWATFFFSSALITVYRHGLPAILSSDFLFISTAFAEQGNLWVLLEKMK